MSPLLKQCTHSNVRVSHRPFAWLPGTTILKGRQITIRSSFDKISKRMSLYEYVYVGAFSRTLHSPWRDIRVTNVAQSQFQPYYKLHSKFLHFRKFRLISSTRGVMFTSFKPCLHFVGRWQTVQTQIRRHITTVASDQVISSSKRLKWGYSIRHMG